jgi:ParB-like chromosome segregation protein Spo0J
MDYKVEFLPVNDLKPYEKNAKTHPQQQIDSIARSIEEFGFRQNLVVDADNCVIIGHGRLLAAKQLGLEEVPCIRATDLTEEQIKALRIADNKISERGQWDTDMLGDELKALADDIDMTQFGFGDFELTILTSDMEPTEYDDDEIKDYVPNSETKLAKKRIIITFTEEQEPIIMEKLGLKELSKILYDITELI